MEAEVHEQVEQPQEAEAQASVSELMDLLQTQSMRCALSGLVLTTDCVSIDHIIPISEGGDDTIGNLQLVHSEINTMKGTMGQDRFIELCRKVASYTR